MEQPIKNKTIKARTLKPPFICYHAQNQVNYCVPTMAILHLFTIYLLLITVRASTSKNASQKVVHPLTKDQINYESYSGLKRIYLFGDSMLKV